MNLDESIQQIKALNVLLKKAFWTISHSWLIHNVL